MTSPTPRQLLVPFLFFMTALTFAVGSVLLYKTTQEMTRVCNYLNPMPQYGMGMGEGVMLPVATGSGAAWNPDQAAGSPDTLQAGDFGSAWASLGTDDKEEWLDLEYDHPVLASSIAIYETFNPGAVERVTIFDASGKEVEVWKGEDPVIIENGKGIATIEVDPPVETKRVKVYVASTKVTGWNEIDAVAITDELGAVYYATSATASSTFANPGPIPPYVDPYEERFKKIEEQLEKIQKKR